MQMQGSRQLTVTAQDAWQALNDPEILKQCIPGCQRFEAESENVYATAANIKIGPVSAKFTGKVELTDINPPHSYTLHFEAQGGVAGHGKGTSRVELLENDTGVELRYTVESQVGGKLAQLGQRLVDGAAKSMADDFFKRFEKALQEKASDSATAEPAGAVQSAAPSGSADAVGSQEPRRGMPKWMWIAIAAVAAAILVSFGNAN